MEIVEEIRQDREKGAKRLESEYKSGLMALARRFCPNESDAEELVNATFATVIENIDSYLEQSAFFGWMCQILTSHHSKNYRRKSNQEIVYPGVLPDVIDEKAQEEIYDHLDATLLRKAIDELPKEQRDAIALHYFMDMSVVQIAKYLAVPNGTVMSRLHYARKALAAKLGAKAENMAKKPGGKAILLALLLCGITALGAAVWNIAVSGESQPPADAGLSLVASPLSSSATAEASRHATSDRRQAETCAATPSAADCYRPSATETFSLTTQGETMDITTTAKTVAAIASASLAFSAAADLPRLDSSQFDYKYEMLKSPTAEDINGGGAVDFTGSNTWLTVGSGANIGTISIDASSNGKYLISNQPVGTAGDGWRSLAASSTDGYTIEARVKVTECTGANGAICLEAGPSDSKVYARLNFYTDKIVWNGTTLTNLDATAWHTYRIARAGGTAVHSVFVDGVLVAGNLGTGFTYNNSTLYRCLLGSPGTGWTGKAQVAYLRFHKGAYAPLDPDDKTRCKASTDFPHQYEMTVNDARFAASENAKTSGTEWTASVGATPTATLNGILSMNPNGKNTAYWATKDGIWKNVVTPETAYTVDFRAKINSCNIDGIDRTLNFMTGTTGPVGSLYVGTNSVSWCLSSSGTGTYVTLDTGDNTGTMHVFRIAYSGGGRHAFTIWRDGVKIGENLVDCTNFYAYQGGSALAIVRFGVVSTSTHGGAFDIDYIRWDTTGAWDWKDPPSAFVMAIR